MSPTAPHAPTFLPEEEWMRRRDEHRRRVGQWTEPHRARAGRGERHPVWDFLFEYYAFRPSWLERWHPGPDVVLQGDRAEAFLASPAYERVAGGVALAAGRLPPGRRQFVAWLADLLEKVRARPAFFGCHGLHEWAMVYRQAANDVRHAGGAPLRFGPERIAAIVDSLPLRCTHFDAFRFFTPPARPLNRLQPERASVAELEQRGCLHANMDLYKWSFKLAPYAPSELIADAFALARDIRAVDMRASPYDLSLFGFDPIPIETSAGRAAYEAEQRGFEARAAPLRLRLIALCERLRQSPADGGDRPQARIGDPEEAQLSGHGRAAELPAPV